MEFRLARGKHVLDQIPSTSLSDGLDGVNLRLGFFTLFDKVLKTQHTLPTWYFLRPLFQSFLEEILESEMHLSRSVRVVEKQVNSRDDQLSVIFLGQIVVQPVLVAEPH